MKIELTDPGLHPLVVDDVDWNGVFALLKMHNKNYTFAMVTDLNASLQTVLIFSAARELAQDNWKCYYYSNKSMT